ncbi:hypothetical protein ACHHYP_14953 [Achlya hypogyna]|uniref:Helicase-associated domain-containing protein n=1 Tax=Achlya hypogyna TaxID=1202772 RepID=A0A1V9YC10_ACHHY|nr:hypothetical protein ACHHYP_14953 [Achlya hypogyna]
MRLTRWDSPCTVEQNADVVALSIFRALYGHCVVPSDFVVPHDSPWPMSLHGRQLGRSIERWRHEASVFHPAHEQALEFFGFVWCNRGFGRCIRQDGSTTNVAWALLLDALRTYHRMHGNCRIPELFVVPADLAIWPRPLVGVRLVSSVRALQRQAFELEPSDHAVAHELGLARDTPPWPDIVKQLKIYKFLQGDADIPLDFVVPVEAAGWPKAWAGVPLGELAWSLGISYPQLTPERQAQLQAVGFICNTDTTWVRIADGLQVFARIFNHVAVPPPFVVPRVRAWPEALW